MTLDASDYISIAALTFSVIAAGLNWWHTNRTFRQATNPEIHFEIAQFDPKGCPLLYLSNLNSTVTVTGLNLVLRYRATDKALFRRGPWRAYFKEDLNPIPPLGKLNGFHHGGNLPELIATNHADFLEKITAPNKDPKYIVKKPTSWEVEVKLSWRGALAGSRKRACKQRLLLSPITRELPYYIGEERHMHLVFQGWQFVT